MRILAYDTSISSPGVALIEVKAGKPVIIDYAHVKTTTEHSHAVRSEIIYAWSTMFLTKHRKKGFDVIIREDFQGRSSMQNHPVFSAWAAVDRSLENFGLSFTVKPISQSAMKKHTVGKGTATKEEIEEAVRNITGFTGDFAANDESDAVAIGLAYLIREGVIAK
jgi:crossover junction endodeoxyribonuclease RuvC